MWFLFRFCLLGIFFFPWFYLFLFLLFLIILLDNRVGGLCPRLDSVYLERDEFSQSFFFWQIFELEFVVLMWDLWFLQIYEETIEFDLSWSPSRFATSCSANVQILLLYNVIVTFSSLFYFVLYFAYTAWRYGSILSF